MWRMSRNYIDKEDKKRYESYDYNKEQEHLCIYKFRCLDDDGEVYFNGFCTSNGLEGITDDVGIEAFSPLNDFGEVMYGCTEIQYKNEKTGKYETL